MATEIRPELSEKNPYWIGKHRYYELKHFCLQYPIWKKAYNALLGLSSRPNDLDIFVKSGQVRSDPTARCAESRVSFAKRMELVEQAAIGTDGDLYPYILRGVTEGLSYNALKMQYAIPCCREVYPDAVHTEISVEYPLNCPEAYAATVMVSPTRDLGEDGYEDYDWSDLELSLSDIEALIGMAKS